MSLQNIDVPRMHEFFQEFPPLAPIRHLGRKALLSSGRIHSE